MKHLDLLALAAAAALAGGCVTHVSLPRRTSSFEVVASGSHGTQTQRLTFPSSPVGVDITVKAMSNHGGYDTTFNGPANIYATPGYAENPDGTRTVTVNLVNGVGHASFDIAGIFSRTHVCVADSLRGPKSTFAAGCTKTFWFQNPSVTEVQKVTTDNTVARLDGDFVRLSRGDLIVTGITADGFYITDRAEPPMAGLPGNFSSIFVYNYSYPDGIEVGDRVAYVNGEVGEFIGDTQLSFPSWSRKDVPTALKDVPKPVVITTAICAATGTGDTGLLCGEGTDNMGLESLESALVEVKNVRTPTKWVDCDLNKDGSVPNYDASCTPGDPRTQCKEIACKVACNKELNCSEISAFKIYGQWSVAMNGGQGPKINVLTQGGFPEFNPMDSKNEGILLDVTGNLVQSLPARPRWIVTVRSPSDVVVH